MPLRVLFLDMNAYFASCEQQLRPELRGKPVAVAAMDTDSTSCIAASYEAKKLGIRTGTPVWKARHAKVQIVEARPKLYVRIHDAIKKAVDTCIPIHGVHSIDEMSCLLDSRQTNPATVTTLAHTIKHAISRDVGEQLKCSIGIAPNRFLAKVAADMQKPDGLTLLNDHDLPHALHPLPLIDLPGIGKNMLVRLAAAGITTVPELCQLSESQIKKSWGSIIGAHWWHLLRGHDIQDVPTRRSSIGHSQVLAPESRTLDGVRGVLIRLLHRASARLRHLSYCAGHLDIHISFISHPGWHAAIPLHQCQDTLSVLEAFESHWHPPFPSTKPYKVAATFHKLTAPLSASLPLFPQEQHRIQLSRALDSLNDKFGSDTVYFADLHHSRRPPRYPIAFNHIPEIPAIDP